MGGNHFEPSFAAGPGGYLVAWHRLGQTHGEVVFKRIALDGLTLQDEVRVEAPGDARNVQVAGDELGWALAWTGSGQGKEIYLLRIDAEGQAQGEPQVVSQRPDGVQGEASVVSLIARIGGWAIAYNEMELEQHHLNIYFQLLDSEGQPEGARRGVATGPSASNSASLTKTQGGFALAWYDLRDGNAEIYSAILDAEGGLLHEHRITEELRSSTGPVLRPRGDGFGLSWQNLIDASNYEIFFQHLDAQGAPWGEPLRLSQGAGGSFAPVSAWNGQEWGVAWHDLRDSENRELYFAQGPMGCPARRP